ncbi:sugar kinase [Oceanobacillus iheyensis HTE831]|uniref:Sugar kinase n=1 Tax=Oceanobacillus iheyensis (strain DSM 14371 / CIP 107618 / JCM 11309 / KCTC 3954 / HTE831) TaxID=221109 RepID=Q8ES63_OCEIH|nr:ROK family protein [Oceanobacillus iheyensis]BAC12736.1 sugar kinase [Oceanobacillus iheyensis HTE831]
MDRYLAFDIGGTFLKYGVVYEDMTLFETNKLKTPNSLEGLLRAMKEISVLYKGVNGVAVSCPGAVSGEGIIKGSSALHYLHGPNVKRLIEDRLNVPIFMENDAHCAGYAEFWKGAAKGRKDVLVMVLGTGIGGAVFKNAELHKGANLHGGEFGYMLLNSEVQDSNDVWSRVASTKALVRVVAERKNIDVDSLTGEQIFTMAEAGDEVCLQALDRFYHLLAVGIYNLQYIYDPEVILLGGGISAREDLIKKIDEKLDGILAVVDLAKVKPNIEACKFKQNANLFGAVYGWLKEFDCSKVAPI